ncbi:MAG: hypothetical protein ACRD3M_07370 [Thermoanaerobaculia bacterium]
MKSALLRSLLFVGMSAAAASAQQTEKKSGPQPGRQMQKLVNALSGTWSIREEYEPSEMMPNGGVGQGQEVWRAGPGGLSLVEEYRSKTSIGEVVGLSVTWWDEKAQGYQALWCVQHESRRLHRHVESRPVGR